MASPSAPAANWKWDPYRTLDLRPQSSSFTCIGAAASKRNARCRWFICDEDCYDACAILDSMAESNPGSSDVDGSLEALSYLLLCKDYHSHQADAKVEDWRERIRPVAQEFRNRRKMVSQIKSLKATVAQYEQEPSRTNELNKKIEDLETNASVLENRISLAETELQTARKLGKRTQKLLEASHTRVSQLESDLQTCIDRHTEEQSITEIEWTSVVSRLQDDLGESQRDLEESRSYRKEQEAGFVLDQSSASLQIFTLHAELKTTRADLKKTQSQLDSTETKFHALQSSTSSRLSELQAELDTAQAEAHNHQSQIESKEGILHAQQQSTSATIATFQIELANTQADLRASQVQLTENKATLQSHQSSSSATMLELSQKFTHSVVQETLLSKKAASLTVALKEANNIITAHQQTLSTLKTQGAKVGLAVMFVTSLQVFGTR